MKVSTENDNNFGYEQITIVVDNMPLKVNMFCFNSIDNEDMLNIFSFWYTFSYYSIDYKRR
jgi:hypothetical protein